MVARRHYDVIIVGLGAMGSAACFHLAKTGQTVLGLDRFIPPHTNGSSHGQTRIIREAYFEHPIYVPLVQRAYALWAELERESGRKLFQQTGGLMIGPPDGIVYSGAKRSAEEHRLPHELLTAAQIRKRFPALQPTDRMAGVWEPRAGILFPEDCVAAHLDLARRAGATLACDEPVVSWTANSTRVSVRTAKNHFEAGQLIISAGAWAGQLLSELPLPIQIERQILFWFSAQAHPEWFQSDRCPIHLWEDESGHLFYGFPDLGHGVKIARHHDGQTVDPDTVQRQVSASEVESVRQLLARFLPHANGQFISATVCLYSNTPDGHFLIDRHPEHPNVLIASPCSGHGFKFSSAIGEVLRDLLLTRRSQFDLSLFRLRTGSANG